MPTIAAATPETDDDGKKIVAMNDRLPTHSVLPSVEDLRANLAGKATEDQIEALTWVLVTARNMSMTTFAAVGQFIKRDASTTSRILRGIYDSDLRPIVADIQKLRDSFNEQQAIATMPFVSELSIVKKRIVPFCEVVRLTQQIGLIWGSNQTGKSWAFNHYSGLPNRDAIVWRLAAGGGVNRSIENLGEACGVPIGKSANELWNRCLERITPNTLLIVDEFHQCFVGRSLKMVLIEKIREIHDVKRCGTILGGTKIFMEALKTAKFRDFLGQLGNRGVLRMHIPTAPDKGDLPLLFRAYGLPEPAGKEKKVAETVANENGIGKLTKYFQIARMLAHNDGQPLGWNYFLKTHDTIQHWSGEVAA